MKHAQPATLLLNHQVPHETWWEHFNTTRATLQGPTFMHALTCGTSCSPLGSPRIGIPVTLWGNHSKFKPIPSVSGGFPKHVPPSSLRCSHTGTTYTPSLTHRYMSKFARLPSRTPVLDGMSRAASIPGLVRSSHAKAKNMWERMGSHSRRYSLGLGGVSSVHGQ